MAAAPPAPLGRSRSAISVASIISVVASEPGDDYGRHIVIGIDNTQAGGVACVARGQDSCRRVCMRPPWPCRRSCCRVAAVRGRAGVGGVTPRAARRQVSSGARERRHRGGCTCAATRTLSRHDTPGTHPPCRFCPSRRRCTPGRACTSRQMMRQSARRCMRQAAHPAVSGCQPPHPRRHLPPPLLLVPLPVARAVQGGDGARALRVCAARQRAARECDAQQRTADNARTADDALCRRAAIAPCAASPPPCRSLSAGRRSRLTCISSWLLASRARLRRCWLRRRTTWARQRWSSPAPAAQRSASGGQAASRAACCARPQRRRSSCSGSPASSARSRLDGPLMTGCRLHPGLASISRQMGAWCMCLAGDVV